MERRKELRLKIKRDVSVTVLGQVGTSTMPATVVDLSGSGMRLRVPFKIPGGAGIKIDARNALVLAEVTRCVRDGKFYELAVTLLHSLSVFKDLEVLNRALFGEEFNHTGAESPAHP